MQGKAVLLILFVLFLLPSIHAQLDNVTDETANALDQQKLDALQQQITSLINQSADFREFLAQKLNGMPDKNQLDSDFSQLDARLSTKIDQKFGAIASLLIAISICEVLLIVILLLFLRMRGLW